MEILFNALVITEQQGKFVGNIREMSTGDLPANDLLIKVAYSSINFKDALSAAGNRGVTKIYPHVPGVDAAGIVVSSKNAAFKAGEQVLVTGFDLGMNTWGGFGEYISVPSEWAISLPKGMSLKDSMCFGTAGLTAALSVNQILGTGLKFNEGEVLVSGATGGVGSIATAILSKLNYSVVAISGKKEESFLLDILGAKRIITRDDFMNTYNNKPISKPAFAACIDTVGGGILSGMIKSVHYGGKVTCCGMVASAELNTSIFPFILRGISLAGIDSVLAPLPLREHLWRLLAEDWKPAYLDKIAQEISLDILAEKLDEIYSGKAKGRFVLKHNS